MHIIEDALISIHAGRKASGVDKEIRTESYPYKDAIKDENATVVDFFDMEQKEILSHTRNMSSRDKRKTNDYLF